MCVGASYPSSQEPVHGRGSTDLLGGDLDGWLRIFLRVSGYGRGMQTGPWGQETGRGHRDTEGTYGSNTHRDRPGDTAGESRKRPGSLRDSPVVQA